MSKYVIFDGIGNIKAAFRLDIASRCTLPKSNSINDIARFGVDKFQFNMLLFASYHLTCTIIVNIVGAKARLEVTGSEGRELLQVVVHFLRDVLKVYPFVNMQYSLGLFGQYMTIYILVKPLHKPRNVVPSHS